MSVNDFLEEAGYLKRDTNNQIDWNKSVAFESVQGTHGININLKGRYSQGCVSQDNLQAVRQDIMSYLKEVINPKTGLLLFKDVMAGEEYYPGSYAKEAPDIMLEPLDYRYLPLGDTYWANHVHRHYQSGWHRREGFWTGTGNKLSGVKKNCSILDIASTLFSLCNKDVPKTMKGSSIV